MTDRRASGDGHPPPASRPTGDPGPSGPPVSGERTVSGRPLSGDREAPPASRPTGDQKAPPARGPAGDPPAEPGELLGGRYRVEGELGVGGMGRVYRARDEALSRPVALKVLHAAMAAHAARFEREARAGAALTHPAVVRVLAYGLLGDARPYLALELVDGESLAAVLRRDGPLSVARALSLLKPIAGALTEAHGRGIVHRDIKPENILLTRPAGMPEMLRLLDFGIAGLLEAEGTEPVERLTVTGQVFGTPEYMAPEQTMGRSTSPATDVWAFGAVLQAMLTGRPPFTGAHLPEILFRVVNAEPAPLPPGLSAGVRALVADCLRKLPEDRPRDGEALLGRVEALVLLASEQGLEAEPLLERPGAEGRRRAALLSLGRGTGGQAPLVLAGGAALLGVAIGLGAGLALGGGSTPAVTPVSPAAVALPAATAPPVDAGVDPAQREREAIRQVIDLLAAGRYGEAVAPARAALAAVGASPPPELREALLAAFARREGAPVVPLVTGPLALEAKDRLLRLAESPEPWLRWRAAKVWPEGGPEARAARLAALRMDLRASDCDARKRTIRDLAELGDPAAIPNIRAARARHSFFENLCLGGADDDAIRRLKRGRPKAP